MSETLGFVPEENSDQKNDIETSSGGALPSQIDELVGQMENLEAEYRVLTNYTYTGSADAASMADLWQRASAVSGQLGQKLSQEGGFWKTPDWLVQLGERTAPLESAAAPEPSDGGERGDSAGASEREYSGTALLQKLKGAAARFNELGPGVEEQKARQEAIQRRRLEREEQRQQELEKRQQELGNEAAQLSKKLGGLLDRHEKFPDSASVNEMLDLALEAQATYKELSAVESRLGSQQRTPEPEWIQRAWQRFDLAIAAERAPERQEQAELTDALQQENRQLQQEKERLQQENNDLMEQIAALQAQVEALSAQREGLSQDGEEEVVTPGAPEIQAELPIEENVEEEDVDKSTINDNVEEKNYSDSDVSEVIDAGSGEPVDSGDGSEDDADSADDNIEDLFGLEDDTIELPEIPLLDTEPEIGEEEDAEMPPVSDLETGEPELNNKSEQNGEKEAVNQEKSDGIIDKETGESDDYFDEQLRNLVIFDSKIARLLYRAAHGDDPYEGLDQQKWVSKYIDGLVDGMAADQFNSDESRLYNSKDNGALPKEEARRFIRDYIKRTGIIGQVVEQGRRLQESGGQENPKPKKYGRDGYGYVRQDTARLLGWIGDDELRLDDLKKEVRAGITYWWATQPEDGGATPEAETPVEPETDLNGMIRQFFSGDEWGSSGKRANSRRNNGHNKRDEDNWEKRDRGRRRRRR